MTEPTSARVLSGELVSSLAGTDAHLVRLGEIDLGLALEQQLYFAIRDGRMQPAGAAARAGALLARHAQPIAAALLGLVAGRRASPGPAPLVILVRDPTHYPVIAQLEEELRRQAGEALVVVRVGRAAGISPAHATAPRLADLVLPRRAFGVLAFNRHVERRLATATADWDAVIPPARATELRGIAAVELPRIALGAAGLASIVDRWRPSVLVAFDEVGTWARLLPAVGSTMGVPTVDLPHAEAADAVAIRGVAYDRMGVYGSRARAVLREAGYADDRIAEIGAPRFDPLVHAAEGGPGPGPRRVVFAAQYVSGAMRPDVHATCYRAALAAANAVDAEELVVVPHPAESAGTAAALVAAAGDSPGLDVRVEQPGTLHPALLGAWLLVTGWSNSVFEAAVAGVPSLTINPGGVAPVDFAADGLALGARDPDEAAAAAGSLLDTIAWQAAVASARERIVERLGPLDGRATERAARLLLQVAAGRNVGAAT